jgi:hypothetical protein
MIGTQLIAVVSVSIKQINAEVAALLVNFIGSLSNLRADCLKRTLHPVRAILKLKGYRILRCFEDQSMSQLDLVIKKQVDG